MTHYKPLWDEIIYTCLLSGCILFGPNWTFLTPMHYRRRTIACPCQNKMTLNKCNVCSLFCCLFLFAILTCSLQISKRALYWGTERSKTGLVKVHCAHVQFSHENEETQAASLLKGWDSDQTHMTQIQEMTRLWLWFHFWGALWPSIFILQSVIPTENYHCFDLIPIATVLVLAAQFPATSGTCDMWHMSKISDSDIEL